MNSREKEMKVCNKPIKTIKSKIKFSNTKEISFSMKNSGIALVRYNSQGMNLTYLSIPKPLRKKKCGTKLMKKVINFADNKCLKISLNAFPLDSFADKRELQKEQKRLVQFYNKFGFKLKKNSDVLMERNSKC